VVVDLASSTTALGAPRRRLHVVAVANFYGPRSGGLRTAVEEIGRAYRALGHDYSLVVPGPVDGTEHTDAGSVHTVAAPVVPGSGGYRVILRLAAVRRLLTSLAPDRLEVSDRTTLHGLGRWAADAGIPAVLVAHERVDGVLEAAGLSPALARLLADARNRASARRFGALVATTAYAASELHRAGAVAHRVPLGVDLDRFHPAAAGAPSRAATGPVRLLLCSRLSREKAPELALDALVELRRRGVAATLTVAGDGPLRRAMERAAGAPDVRFLGFVSDRRRLTALLGEADVVLAPGPIETFGLAALEALACGTPVVAHERSAVREVIGADPASGGTAPGTPAGFADAVERLLEIPERRRREAARGRAEQFTWHRTVAALLALPFPTARPSRLSGRVAPSR
jgi:alpha-1,6-mannosyltransferase